MIGLRRGTVKLKPYNPRWAIAFRTEERRLRRALGKLVVDIQHIGSTAISGMAAKPIIDISVGVRTMGDAGRCIQPLRKLGYEWRRDFGGPHVQLLFVKGPEQKRTHYLHLMKYDGALWENDIFFRNYLRRHKRQAKAYANLKRRLAARFSSDRPSYTSAKAKFILGVIKKASGDHHGKSGVEN